MMSFLFDRVSLKCHFEQQKGDVNLGVSKFPPKFAGDLLLGTKSHRLGGPIFSLETSWLASQTYVPRLDDLRERHKV